jgi:deoxyribonuclease-4
MSSLRSKYDLNPLVIHANYLINVAGVTPEFHRKSVEAFRAEVQRGIALCADFLVFHPGSFRGGTREEGLTRAAEAIEEAVDGLHVEQTNLKVTVENTAGAEYSLGGSFEQVAELMGRLRKHVPVAACIDTCHTHVAGYNLTTRKGFEATMEQLDATVGIKNVGVWHCNDAKAACGSKLDRHQHIGRGTIGLEPFRWLLNDPRVAHAAFIAETPIDEPLDDLRNIDALKSCVKNAKPRTHDGGTKTWRKDN